MEISNTHNLDNLQKNKITKAKPQIQAKEILKIDTSSQNALEQIGRAQLKINFKGNQKEIPEPIPYEEKIKTIEQLNLSEDSNSDYLLTLSDKRFLLFTKIIEENSIEKLTELYKKGKVHKSDFDVLEKFYKTGKLPKRQRIFTKFTHLETSEKLLTENNKDLFEEFYKRGLSCSNALILAHFKFNSNEEIDRVVELTKKGVYAYGAQIHCRSKEAYEKKIRELESSEYNWWERNKDYDISNDSFLYKLCYFKKHNIDFKYIPESILDKKPIFAFYESEDDNVHEQKILRKYLQQGNLTYQEAREKSSKEALNKFLEICANDNIEEDVALDFYNHINTKCYGQADDQALRIYNILIQGADLSYATYMEEHFFVGASGQRFKPCMSNFEEMVKNGVNPKVAQIIATTEIKAPEKIELIEKLIDKKFVEEIKKKVNNPNLNNDIDKIFNIRRFESPIYAKSLLESDLSYEDIVSSAVKLMKSPIKLALKKPQQYLNDIPIEHTTKINGKYPALNKEQEEYYQSQIRDFFKKDFKYTLRAIKYLDNDTFNQLMDKRFNSFEEELKNINKLTNKNYELLSKLLITKTSNNKPLPANEKIKLANIVLQLQNARMLNDFEFIDKEGYLISNQELHEKLQNKIFEILGLAKEEIANIPKNKLDFDENNIYSLLSVSASGAFPDFLQEVVQHAKQYPEDVEDAIKNIESMLNNEEEMQHVGATKKQCEAYLTLFKNINTLSEEEIFKLHTIIFNDEQTENRTIDVIKVALFNNFKDYIQNESNEFGQTNAKTREKFELLGINYDTWINYDNTEKINLNNQEFKLQIWDRYPQKDLFIGNRTSCCTGIGEVNGKSTATYLANTAFNVIELKDEKDNVIGMSRIHIANVDSKPALILDNIEVNNAFLKITDDSEKIKLRNEFFKYAKNLAKSISNENIPIYFSTSYTKLETNDLEKTTKEIDFVGECANSFYSNAIKGWTCAEKFKETECDLYII